MSHSNTAAAFAIANGFSLAFMQDEALMLSSSCFLSLRPSSSSGPGKKIFAVFIQQLAASFTGARSLASPAHTYIPHLSLSLTLLASPWPPSFPSLPSPFAVIIL